MNNISVPTQINSIVHRYVASSRARQPHSAPPTRCPRCPRPSSLYLETSPSSRSRVIVTVAAAAAAAVRAAEMVARRELLFLLLVQNDRDCIHKFKQLRDLRPEFMLAVSIPRLYVANNSSGCIGDARLKRLLRYLPRRVLTKVLTTCFVSSSHR